MEYSVAFTTESSILLQFDEYTFADSTMQSCRHIYQNNIPLTNSKTKFSLGISKVDNDTRFYCGFEV